MNSEWDNNGFKKRKIYIIIVFQGLCPPGGELRQGVGGSKIEGGWGGRRTHLDVGGGVLGVGASPSGGKGKFGKTRVTPCSLEEI